MNIYLRHGNDDKHSVYKQDNSLNSSKETEQAIIKKTKWLIETYGYPQKIYSSPFKRCRSTLRIMLNVLKNYHNVSIDPCLSRRFVNKEAKNPSVRPTTMQYHPPIQENNTHFKARVDKAEERAKKYHGVTWSITHYLVMKALCKKHNIILPAHMPFLYHVII